MNALIERLYGTNRIMKNKRYTETDLPDTKNAIGNIFRISWPTIVEMLLIAAVSIADTAMVSSIGDEAIAAVGLSTQPRFLLVAVFFSINAGILAIISRRKGEDDQEGANKALRQIIFVSSLLAVILSVVGAVFARDLVIFIGAQEDTVELATTYAQIVMGGLFFNAMTMNINAAQRGCGNSKLSMRTNIIANLINLLFNYLLIEGRFGFPALGIQGAAIATVLGYVVAFIIALASVLRPGKFLHLSFKKSFLPDSSVMSPFIKVSSSAGVEQVFMRVGFIIFAKIIANLGTEAYAAHQICINIMNIAFSFGEGLSAGTSALVGQNLGRRRPGEAHLYGLLSQRLGLTIGLILMVIFLLGRRIFVMPFTSTESVIEMGSTLLICLAFLVPAQISQMIFSSSLRVSGDTLYVALSSLIGITFVRTLSAYILCYPVGLGVVGAWLGIVIDQYLRLCLNGYRFSTGKWKLIRL